MAKEILKDEILSEAELDNVAGGTVVQTASDSQFLRDSGAVPGLKGWGNHAMEHNFAEYSGLVADAWAKCGITCTPSADGENAYSMNGKSITRYQAYQEIAKQTGFKFQPRSYGFPSNDPRDL